MPTWVGRERRSRVSRIRCFRCFFFEKKIFIKKKKKKKSGPATGGQTTVTLKHAIQTHTKKKNLIIPMANIFYGPKILILTID
jgi:hypothetical protein